MRMHPAPRQLSMDQWMSYRSAWGALTADDPGMVGAFASSNTQASSHLRQAMAHVLRRYPERASGLDFWDRQLLANIRKHGPKASRIVGHAMGENIDSGDLIADRYLMWRLLHLASPQLPRPLLSVSGDTRDIQDSNFELNDFGLQVCDGKASAWPANPIDYWAGGVHISSEANNLWFIEEGKPARA
jgi:hypothetical protein